MSWKLAKLGEICDFQGGSQPPKSAFVYEKKNNYIRFIQIRDFKSKNNLTYIPPSKKNRYCNQDDILIGRYGASVGKILTGLSGAYNVALMKTIPKQDIIDKNYLHLYLSSDLFQKPLIKVSERSAQNGFSKDDIFNFKVPLPSIEEQQQIVAKIYSTFTEIDKCVVNISIIENQLKVLTKNYIAKIINNIKYQWEEKTLPEISINLDNKRIPITKSKRDQGKIPYYGASGIVDYVKDWIFDDDLLLVSEDGANLLMRTYPIAFNVSGKCWVNNHAHILKFKNKNLQYWVEIYLNSINLSDYVTGMAQPKLNQTKLNTIKIPVPRDNLSEDLINNIKIFKKNCKLYKSQITQKNSLYKLLKSSLLKQKLNNAA